MTWVSMENGTLHVFVGGDPTDGNETYLAFIQHNADGFRASIPDWRFHKADVNNPPKDWFYTHDTLEAAKQWCIVELVKRRLSQ